MGHHLKVFAKKNKMELIFVNKRGYSEIRIASFFLSNVCLQKKVDFSLDSVFGFKYRI